MSPRARAAQLRAVDNHVPRKVGRFAIIHRARRCRRYGYDRPRTTIIVLPALTWRQGRSHPPGDLSDVSMPVAPGSTLVRAPAGGRTGE